MDIPADWFSEAQLAAASGVSDDDRSKFHRNLLNWRHHGLLPRCYDGLPVPMIHHLGVGVGNEAFHPPITLPMIRRIDELQRESRDMDEWLWRLWLDGYPVNIIEWCRRRLTALAAAISGADEKRLNHDATRKPAKRLDPRRLIYRLLRTQGWYALMAWTVAVAIGARSAASLFDAASSPLAMLTGRKDVTGAAIVENMGLNDLLAVLNQVGETEIEKVREDCRVISRAGNVRNLARLVLTAMWRRMDTRAILLPGLIALRRSPGHQGSLIEVLGETDPSQ
jgi:hypothetical protein